MQDAMATALHVSLQVEDGSMWATVREFPGVFATGDTLDEVRESLQEGIALYLADSGRDPPVIELSPLSTQALEASAELVYG